MQVVCDSGKCSDDGVCGDAFGGIALTAAEAAAFSGTAPSAGQASAPATAGAAPSTAAALSAAATPTTASPAAVSAPRVNRAPTLALNVTSLASIQLKQGLPYERCTGDQDPLGSVPCEAGATAADDNDVGIQAKVGQWTSVSGLTVSTCNSISVRLQFRPRGRLSNAPIEPSCWSVLHV